VTTEPSQSQDEITKLKDQVARLQTDFGEGKQSDFEKVKDLEDTVEQLKKDKEMLTNKALQMSGKNAGNMLTIQDLEDQIAKMEYGSK
jgi:predicted  nucleic acid-binding Zn-ribbon protein